MDQQSTGFPYFCLLNTSGAVRSEHTVGMIRTVHDLNSSPTTTLVSNVSMKRLCLQKIGGLKRLRQKYSGVNELI